MTSADHRQPTQLHRAQRRPPLQNKELLLCCKPDSLPAEMWIQALILCLSCLSRSGAQQRASPHRPAEQAGQCQYTFTVSGPVESSCSAGSLKPELDGLVSRLALLEALVSRLIAGVDGSAGAGAEATGEEVLQEAYTQVTLERDQLEQEKESLNRQVLELQSRLDEQLREAERLRQKPCPQTHASAGGQHRERPASGTCITWARTHISFFGGVIFFVVPVCG